MTGSNPLEAFAARILDLSEKATPGPIQPSVLQPLYLVDGDAREVVSFADFNDDGSVALEFANAEANKAKIAHLWNHATTLAAIAKAAAAMERALILIAAQTRTDEMGDDEHEHADFEGSYDQIVTDARSALAAMKKEMET